jgi:3-deoxy-manno-octulosonate cytidylyltransferase (CMP-KDO synthetase)
MRKVAMIPARYAATRFPFKLMQMLGNKTVIRRTYENTLQTGLFDNVVVVTDSDIIFNEIVGAGGNAVMSKKNHESGSDRIAEAVEHMDADIILNVQGDEPFVKKQPLQDLLQAFEGHTGKEVEVASLMRAFTDLKNVSDPNYVKVVVDKHMRSLLFSRSIIPYHRDEAITPVYYEHIGVYAFRKHALMQFTKWPVTPLEAAEKIECLRYLEHGIRLKMVVTDIETVKIDVPSDLDLAISYLNNQTTGII